MENKSLRMQDVVLIIKRRKFSIIVPFFFAVILATILVFALPPVYLSSSTILIEDQEIPSDFVRTTVTSFVEKRLQEIKQKIISTSRLQEIIDKYELYADAKKYKTKEEIIENMRDDINLQLINAEVIDKRTGRNTNVTVAFTLSYEGENDPVKVQRVASVLTSLFLEENIKVRERQTRETSIFFEEEKNKIEKSIYEIEAEISSFKEKHINELPELMQVNTQELHLTEMNIERYLEQLRSLKEKEASFIAQLSSTSPQLADEERMSKLMLELNRLKSLYSDEYPEIIYLKKEIDELGKRTNCQINKNNISNTVGKPTNPAYINIASQLSSAQSEIQSVKQQIANYEKKSNLLREYIKSTPVVEQEYRKLLMERDSLKIKYDDLMQKFMEARVAQGLESDQKGERFTLIDPALLPEKPYKPNRLAIFIIGIVLGIGCSIGLTAILEITDDTIRDARQLSLHANVPVLSVIPVYYNARETAEQKKRRNILMISGPVGLVVVLLIFHFFVMDLYVFWAKAMRNLTF